MEQFVLYFYFIAALLSSSPQMSQAYNIVIWYNKALIHIILSKYVHIKSYKYNNNVKFKSKFTLTEDCLYTGSSYNSQITFIESNLVITSDISFLSHYYIFKCTNIITSDMANMSVITLTTILSDRVGYLLLVEYVEQLLRLFLF